MQNKNNIMIKLNIILFSINRREAAAAPSKLLFFFLFLFVVVKLVMISESKKESPRPGPIKKNQCESVVVVPSIRSFYSFHSIFISDCLICVVIFC